MTKLLDVEGIGPVYADKLKKAGVPTLEALLEQCATPAGRKAVAEKSGIGHDYILKWANHADLFRIKGVAEEYSELLEAAGVDTVVELAKRNAQNLHQALVQTNARKKLVRRLPTAGQVANWIAQAARLPRKLSY
jgi:predicted flap endonuclease-1-like 5' DNA nuclease